MSRQTTLGRLTVGLTGLVLIVLSAGVALTVNHASGGLKLDQARLMSPREMAATFGDAPLYCYGRFTCGDYFLESDGANATYCVSCTSTNTRYMCCTGGLCGQCTYTGSVTCEGEDKWWKTPYTAGSCNSCGGSALPEFDGSCTEVKNAANCINPCF